MKMKSVMYSVGVMVALGVGFWLGHSVAMVQTRADILCGPYSDDYGPAIQAVSQARSELESGNCDVIGDLDSAQFHIERARDWTEQYLHRK